MTVQTLAEPLESGTNVRILNARLPDAIVAEYRGPLGPKGKRVYRVMVPINPDPLYLEVLEEQLEVLSLPVPSTGSPALP